MTEENPIVQALLLSEAVASVKLSHDPDVQTISLGEQPEGAKRCCE